MTSKRARTTSSLGNRIGAIQQGMAALEARDRTPAPDETPATLEYLRERLELLESANYRYENELATLGQEVTQALLPADYVGPGPTPVTFLDPNISQPGGMVYQWLGKFEPWGNRVVNMVRQNGTWLIQGHSNVENYGGKISLMPYLGNNIAVYAEYPAISRNTYGRPRAQRLSSGIVVLSGLLLTMTSTPAGTVLMTLPPGYRPDNNMTFGVENSGSQRMVTIRPNGEMLVETTAFVATSNDFFSIDGIAFPAAGVATWTPITEWLNGWSAWTSPAFGVPSYWKDPYGVVWFQGLIRPGTRGGDLGMFQIPATHCPAKQTHNKATSSAAWGYYSVFPANHGSKPRMVTDKGGNPTFSWISLCDMRIVTPDAYTASKWLRPNLYNGSWNPEYGTGFPRLGVTRRPDGLALTEGLCSVSSGTSDVWLTSFQDWVSPEKVAIIQTVGADVKRRLDIVGMKWTDPSSSSYGPASVGANGTHSSWTSFDGLVWMVGD